MIELLNSIVSFIVSIWNLIIDVFQAFITIILSIPQYLNFINVSISVFPSFLLPYAFLGVSLTVIAMLIRRDVF